MGLNILTPKARNFWVRMCEKELFLKKFSFVWGCVDTKRLESSERREYWSGARRFRGPSGMGLNVFSLDATVLPSLWDFSWAEVSEVVFQRNLPLCGGVR